MWNCPNKPIPEFQIREAHLRVLENASQLETPDTEQVQSALAYLESKALRRGGFTLYRAWLRQGGEHRFNEAIVTIKKHLGM